MNELDRAELAGEVDTKTLDPDRGLGGGAADHQESAKRTRDIEKEESELDGQGDGGDFSLPFSFSLFPFTPF